MAYSLVTTLHRYVGTSQDAKPTSGVTIGSTFQEIDTGANYVFSSLLKWELDKAVALSVGEYRSGIAEMSALLENIYLELRAANLANGVEVR